MLITAAVLVCAVHSRGAGALDDKLTYTCVASPAPTVLTALSEQAGVKLTCSGPIADETLVIRFKDVPLQTAMSKLAIAATGEWVKVDDGFRLERPTTLVNSIKHKR